MSLGPCVRGRLPALSLVTWARPPFGESSLVSNHVKGIAELSLPLQKKAPPPPPTSFPRVPQVAPPGPAGPPTASVNVFSRKAGNSYSRNQGCLCRTMSYGIQSSVSCLVAHAVCARENAFPLLREKPSSYLVHDVI